jgi:hypothetical protein
MLRNGERLPATGNRKPYAGRLTPEAGRRNKVFRLFVFPDAKINVNLSKDRFSAIWHKALTDFHYSPSKYINL